MSSDRGVSTTTTARGGANYSAHGRPAPQLGGRRAHRPSSVFVELVKLAAAAVAGCVLTLAVQFLLPEPVLWATYGGEALSMAALLAFSVLLIVASLMYVGKRRAERALRQTEDRYRHVVESQTELICRYAPDTTLTFVNDAYCRHFGSARGELLGRRFIELIPEPERPRVLERVQSLIADIGTVSYMHQATMSDGSVRWQQWLDHPIVDAEGKVVEVQGIGRDVTELKAA
jgi:PAS domain S-box-containing protein